MSESPASTGLDISGIRRRQHEQVVLSWEAVQSLPNDGTAVWTTDSLAPRVAAAMPFQLFIDSDVSLVGISRVISVGGGSLIDRVKFWRMEHSPETWLVAVPSLWGSGAEASSVAVRLEAGRKVPHIDTRLLPNARAIWPELAESIPANLAKWGMGDVWSHALEAFFSPLASNSLRVQLAAFLRDKLLPQPLIVGARWFELSAEACQLQSIASVGLVHGMAHEIEPLLPGFGHARLCSTLLWPVMCFNVSRSSKFQNLAAAYGLPLEAVLARIHSLYSNGDFDELLPILITNWINVLANPLSRINRVVCRPQDLAWFTQREFMQK